MDQHPLLMSSLPWLFNSHMNSMQRGKKRLVEKYFIPVSCLYYCFHPVLLGGGLVTFIMPETRSSFLWTQSYVSCLRQQIICIRTSTRLQCSNIGIQLKARLSLRFKVVFFQGGSGQNHSGCTRNIQKEGECQMFSKEFVKHWDILTYLPHKTSPSRHPEQAAPEVVWLSSLITRLHLKRCDPDRSLSSFHALLTCTCKVNRRLQMTRCTIHTLLVFLPFHRLGTGRTCGPPGKEKKISVRMIKLTEGGEGLLLRLMGWMFLFSIIADRVSSLLIVTSDENPTWPRGEDAKLCGAYKCSITVWSYCWACELWELSYLRAAVCHYRHTGTAPN